MVITTEYLAKINGVTKNSKSFSDNEPSFLIARFVARNKKYFHVIMNGNDIIFSLNVDDIQQVALENIDRELTAKETDRVKEKIAEKINWYDAIFFAISEEIREQ